MKSLPEVRYIEPHPQQCDLPLAYFLIHLWLLLTRRNLSLIEFNTQLGNS